MRSLLNEIKDKFLEIDNNSCNECNGMIVDNVCESCGGNNAENEIEEQNVTGNVAGYNTPSAFAAPGKWKSKSIKYESVNVNPSYKIGEYQQPESDEEIFNDKFPFATTNDTWWQSDAEYPVKYYSDGMGTGNIKDTSTRVGKLPDTSTSARKLKSEDILENQYLKLIEGYRAFATNDPKISPEKKVKNTIKEIAKKLQEIETLVNHNSKLKTESGVTSSVYGPSEQKALTKISERLIKISERVRTLGE